MWSRKEEKNVLRDLVGIQRQGGEAMKCPKCGSEMEHAIGRKGTIAEGIEEWYCRKCGHEEDVTP